MNRFISLILILFSVIGCTREIGTVDFDTAVEKKYTVFIPETGTFVFSQEYTIEPTANKIKTNLKILNDSKDPQEVAFEILVFKNDKLSYDGLDFVSRKTLKTNEGDFHLINSEGGSLLNDVNHYICIFDTSNDAKNMSGHYDGKVELFTTDGNVTTIDEVFSVFGNINREHQILLVSLEKSASITYIKGTYTDSGSFSGVGHNEDSELSIKNDSEKFQFNLETKLFEDTLDITQNSTTKKLKIILKRTNP